MSVWRQNKVYAWFPCIALCAGISTCRKRSVKCPSPADLLYCLVCLLLFVVWSILIACLLRRTLSAVLLLLHHLFCRLLVQESVGSESEGTAKEDNGVEANTSGSAVGRGRGGSSASVALGLWVSILPEC